MASYVHFAVPEVEAKKVRDASEVTRVPQTQILRQLIEQHLDEWVRRFYANRDPATCELLTRLEKMQNDA